MLHRFLRISTVSHIVRTPYLLVNNSRHVGFENYARFYSKKSSLSGPNCPEDVNKKVKQAQDNICVTARKRPIPVCKPVSKKPCIPCPPPDRMGVCKYPPDPNRMDTLPKPSCPWDECQKEADRRYRRHLLLGLLALGAALAAMWWNVEFTKREPDPSYREFLRPKPSCKIPAVPGKIPSHAPYLLIGGGTASFSAFRAIKSADPTAKVLVVSKECYFPYMRPPLSKEMWFTENEAMLKKMIFKQWNGTERSIFYEPDSFYIAPDKLTESPKGGVAVIQGYSVKKIDVVERIAYLEDDTEITYDKCLVATGARPKNLEVFEKANSGIRDKVTLFRDIFDYRELNEICRDAKSVAIVGGGFLGSELACALGRIGKKNNMKVHQVFRESGNMGKVLPEYLSNWTTDRVRREGVSVLSETEVEDVSMNDKKQLQLHLNNGNKLVVDQVIVAVGVLPNDQLAKTSDLEIDPELGGYLVNAEMEARSHLYIAGDCSCFYDIKLGRRRVEHHDHAVVSGRLAGENMAGAAKPYVHQSMFWSDLGPDVGYEAIGIVDSSLPTVGVFAEVADDTAGDDQPPKQVIEETTPTSKGDKCQQTKRGRDYCKGVIFYLRDDIVVGIVLWNVFNRMSIARQVLKDEKKYDDLNEVAKLFKIHDTN